MIYGMYLSQYSVVDIAKFVPTNGTIDLEYAYVHARIAGRDDAKWSEHRALMRTLRAKNGAFIWGASMFLGYAPGNPSGYTQAVDFWNLINAGGREWEIPPIIDAEYQPEKIVDGKVISYYKPAATYVDDTLKPAVRHILDKYGHYPTLYTNLLFIKEVLSNGYTVTPPEWLLKCPLHIAYYSQIEAPAFRYWKTYQFWQFTNTTNWQGATSICLDKRPGTRQELKDWCKNPTPDWKPGDVQPEPEPEPEPKPEPEPGEQTQLDRIESALAALTEQLDRIEAAQAAQAARWQAHYKEV